MLDEFIVGGSDSYRYYPCGFFNSPLNTYISSPYVDRILYKSTILDMDSGRFVRGVGNGPSNMPNFIDMLNNGLVSFNKDIRNHMYTGTVIDVTRCLHPNAHVSGLFQCLFFIFYFYFALSVFVIEMFVIVVVGVVMF